MNKISLFVTSFGIGSGIVALVIGITNGEGFLTYIGLVCFISNLMSMRKFMKDVT